MHWETIHRVLSNRAKKLGIKNKYINKVVERITVSCGAITMIFTYNQLYRTENLYIQFYQTRAKQLEITKNYITYVQGRTTASRGATSMFITHNE
jgi:hypothetical protein